MIAHGEVDDLAAFLRTEAAARKANDDGIWELLIEAAQTIEKLADWCRKLIEAGKFPGEIGNPLQ